ncbi:MAG: c-type cytochrome domain-containing protein [Chloroflexota bacterium]|nr:c-type cytochrome domain-containing protein [Chloroflexota bacterium]
MARSRCTLITMLGLVLLAFSLWAAGCVSTRREAPPPPKDVALQDVPQFQLDVLPTFNQFCVKCHSQYDSHAGLRLDSYAQLMKGSSRGPVAIPGDPENSILLRALKQDPRLAMPFHGQKLPPNRIANIERWISQGAGNN